MQSRGHDLEPGKANNARKNPKHQCKCRCEKERTPSHDDAMSGIVRGGKKREEKKRKLSMAKVSSMSSSGKVAARSSSLIERSTELHPDAVAEARLAALDVGK